jgi:hypothetical protein
MREKARRRDRARELDHVAHFEKKIFDEWPLKNGERVSTDRSSGFDLVHIRRWQPGPTGQLYATEKGIAIAVGDLSRLLKALKKVRAHAREIALLPKPKRQKIQRGRK